MHSRTVFVHQQYRGAVSVKISNWISTRILARHHRYSQNTNVPQRPKFAWLTHTIMVRVYPYLQMIVHEIVGTYPSVAVAAVFWHVEKCERLETVVGPRSERGP